MEETELDILVQATKVPKISPYNTIYASCMYSYKMSNLVSITVTEVQEEIKIDLFPAAKFTISHNTIQEGRSGAWHVRGIAEEVGNTAIMSPHNVCLLQGFLHQIT